MPFTLTPILVCIRDYGWMMALAGLGLLWLLRETSHPVLEVLMALIFAASILLLTSSILLHLLSFEDLTKRKEPPAGSLACCSMDEVVEA